MSRIVKAKWVIHSPVVQKRLEKEEAHKGDDRKQEEADDHRMSENGCGGENQIDHQLEAIRKANDLMKSALRSSREIAEKSQEDGFGKGYDEGYQVGYETGFEEGVANGKKDAKEQVEVVFEEIKALAGAIRSDREQAIFQREDEIISFAMEIAKKIMRYEIKKDEESFTRMFHEVIHEDDEGVKIYLSEYQKTLDLYLQKSMVEKIKKLSKKMKVVLLKEDDKIVVETDEAVIDMAVPVQMEEIKKAIDDNH